MGFYIEEESAPAPTTTGEIVPTDIYIRGTSSSLNKPLPEYPTNITSPAVTIPSGFYIEPERPVAAPVAIPKPLPLTAGETFTGGMSDILDKLALGGGDEIIAGGSAILDALGGGNYQQSFDSTYNQAKDLRTRYAKENPTSSLANNLLGFGLPIPAPIKDASAATNILKSALTGGALGTAGGYLSGEGATREKEAIKGAKFGAGVGAAFGAAGELLRKAAPAIKSLARGSDRKSLGAGVSDYNKTANELGIISDADGNSITRTKEALDDILGSGQLGKSRDPGIVSKNAQKAEQELEDKVGEIIKRYERTNSTPVKPNFTEAYKFIEEGRVPADKIDQYIERLLKLEKEINSQGKGKLSFMQNQKIAQGKLWTEGDTILNEFDRKIYTDLKKTIEKAVPQVSPLNQELGKWQLVKPVIKKALARSENEDPLEAVKRFFYTTTGYGATIATGVKVAGIPGALAGIGAGAALQAAKTPRGMAEIARGLNKIADNPESLNRLGNAIITKDATARQKKTDTKVMPKIAQSKPRTELKDILPLFNNGANQAQRQEISSPPIPSQLKRKVSALIKEQPPLVQAVIQVESGGNPLAKSSTGPIGLMQLTKATARKLGVEDRKDPAQNIEGGIKLLKELSSKFDDPRIVLAGYNQGEPEIRLAMKKARLDGKDASRWENIKSYLTEEGQKYPSLVEQALKKIEV